ncbi:MAG TPA: Coenzyme F420 hydrogenase/dehydrogenase, beta subunit C-terminal domain [Candidatus Limnocylindrales bacterium]|nr:Coenzyme F420 hydrogenase/dehydrogenase, beta subunit C-terminal domain [Candidatus Limnocylindrales bacterium]
MSDSVDNPLIAYNLLEKKIIKSGLCTACGACEIACPVEALQIEDEKVKRLRDCSKDLDLCPICYEICPHSDRLLLRSLRPVSEAPVRSEALGYYRKLLLAQAADQRLRGQSHGAAVVTALLKYGIEEKIFDSAIVSQGEAENPSKPKPSVAVVPDDVLFATGSKFFPSAVARAFGSAVTGYGKTKIAFVGVPCHVLALRKMEAWQHKFSSNLKITIGLFCFGSFSLTPLIEHITKTYKIKPTQIKSMYLSKEFVVETVKGEVRIPMEEIEQHILLSCQTCMDFTSELADLSIGSAYPLTDWSMVIIRTKEGEDFFYGAVEKGVINTWAIEAEPRVFERVVKAALTKRVNALKAVKKLEEEYGFLPVRLLRETEALAHVKVKDIMKPNIKTVPSNMTVSQLLELMAKHQYTGYPVTNESGELVGTVTIEEASMVGKKQRDRTSVGAIARPNLDVVYPEETALDALRKMSKQETGRVIVLDPADPKKMIGIVTKADLMHALVRSSE